jgi:hypothetical protein
MTYNEWMMMMMMMIIIIIIIIVKEGLIRVVQLKTTYIIPLVLSTMDIGPNKLHET